MINKKEDLSMKTEDDGQSKWVTINLNHPELMSVLSKTPSGKSDSIAQTRMKILKGLIAKQDGKVELSSTRGRSAYIVDHPGSVMEIPLRAIKVVESNGIDQWGVPLFEEKKLAPAASVTGFDSWGLPLTEEANVAAVILKPGVDLDSEKLKDLGRKLNVKVSLKKGKDGNVIKVDTAHKSVLDHARNLLGHDKVKDIIFGDKAVHEAKLQEAGPYDGLDQYFETALWSSTDENDDPLDSNYSVNDLSPEAMAQAKKEWDDFKTQAGDLLDGISLADAAHDFWLTRNGHGAGFWDRGYGEIGEKLTDLCKKFGSVDLYVGDDGKLYFSGGSHESVQEDDDDAGRADPLKKKALAQFRQPDFSQANLSIGKSNAIGGDFYDLTLTIPVDVDFLKKDGMGELVHAAHDFIGKKMDMWLGTPTVGGQDARAKGGMKPIRIMWHIDDPILAYSMGLDMEAYGGSKVVSPEEMKKRLDYAEKAMSDATAWKENAIKELDSQSYASKEERDQAWKEKYLPTWSKMLDAMKEKGLNYSFAKRR